MALFGAANLAAQPDYDRDNPIATLTQRAKSIALAAHPDLYVADSLHYLFPLASFGLPSEDPTLATDGRASTKEALRSYRLGAYYLVKGLINYGGSRRNFLRVGCTGPLENAASVEVHLNDARRQTRVQEGAVEFWNLFADAKDSLPHTVRQAIQSGGVVLDAAFPPGNPLDYQPSRIKGTVWDVGDPNDINHPLRVVKIRLKFLDSHGKTLATHEVAFKMIRRGFDSFRSSRWSNNPHGGTGSIESTVFYVSEFNDPDHILRDVAAGRPLSNGEAAPAATIERFFPAKYMQYIRFGPSASIGIHRHKDFLDAFWVTRGSGMGVLLDAVALDGAEPTAELRRLRAFEGMIVRPGQMHGILRDTEEPLEMFAFGAPN
jgi:hypothetical protein